jgi:hypothetical protein
MYLYISQILSTVTGLVKIRDGSVGIAIRLRDGRQGFDSRLRTIFSSDFRPSLGPTQPHIQWVPRSLSPGVKRLGREADHSSPSSSEIKNCGITSALPYMPLWHTAELYV